MTETTPPDPSIANRKSAIANLLSRPPEQRLREYKYRFSQSIVFGLPVVALQLYGRALGPADSEALGQPPAGAARGVGALRQPRDVLRRDPAAAGAAA